MANDLDPISWIKRLTEAGTRVRLAPGVIGKSSAIYIGVVVLWGIVLTRLTPTGPWWFNGALVGVATYATLVASRWTKHMRNFAEKNPSLALMEGADITEYKKFEAQSKALPAGDKSPPVVVVGPESHGTAVARPGDSQP
jgi:hypothetical protein